MAPVYKFSAAGSLATSRTVYKSMLAGNAAYNPSSYESIATVSVGAGGVADATFNSIPTTWTHLQVRGYLLGSAAASGSIQYQFNSDTASNYNSHLLGGNGTTVSAYSTGSETFGRLYGYYDNLANNGYPLGFIMDILDYSNVNKFKTVRTLSGMDKNGNNYGEIFLYSSLWRSTSAVSTIKIYVGGQNLGQYSNIALYGIKGA